MSPVPLPTAGLAERPIELLLVLGALALLPVALVTLTSFLKMSVVLSLARSALGAPQVPSSTAVSGLALLLTLLVMQPVAAEGLQRARAVRAADLQGALDAASELAVPLEHFLARFAAPDDRATFLELARRSAGARAAAVTADDLAVLAPAFVVSELRRAFTLGFAVFLPFLVVDLLVANVLLALGLTQLSPSTIALPFKLMLFVAVDGWRLLARGLVAGYLG